MLELFQKISCYFAGIVQANKELFSWKVQTNKKFCPEVEGNPVQWGKPVAWAIAVFSLGILAYQGMHANNANNIFV